MVTFANSKLEIITQYSKILVTGGTGFLGSYIIKQLLNDGFEVRAIKRASAAWPFYQEAATAAKVEWVEGDILDILSLTDAMQGVDAVIHAAALVSMSNKDRSKMYKVNVEGTANIVNVALEEKVQRLIYVSSVAALGRKNEGNIVTETAKWEDSKTNTQYAISKYKAEIEVWRSFEEGLQGVIVNPSTIFGYGNWHQGSNAIFKNVYDEYGWYTNGANGFVDVVDVAKAVVALLKSNITEQRFIVNAETWSFKKLFDVMADAFGKKRPSKKVTPFIAEVAWRLEKLKSFFTGKTPLITKESAKVAQSNTHFENGKLLKALPDFKFKPLEQTIKEAAEKYSNSLNGS